MQSIVNVLISALLLSIQSILGIRTHSPAPLKRAYIIKEVINGPLKFLTARKILPLLDLLAKFKRVLACSCSPNFCVARKLAKQISYFCSCSQQNRSARHARECSQRPFVTPNKTGTQYAMHGMDYISRSKF